MTRAEVLVKCHTGHSHALLNIVNHFIVNMAARIAAAIRRDHNFIAVALVIILMTVGELRRCLALPLTATLFL